MSAPAAPPVTAAPNRSAIAIVVGLVAVVTLVGVVRLAAFGWSAIAPDDARYVYVGLSTLAGDGPVTPSGNLFLLRSPLYGILLAGGAQLTENPLDGARIVAALMAFAMLGAALALTWQLAGWLAAAATAIAILAMPLIWDLLPTLRIDLAQTAGVLAVLICLHRPTTRRWALAGVVLGLTVLIKETVALLALLPLAALGFIPIRRLARFWLIYLAAAGAVAGWWWILVWLQAGVIFPLNAIGVIERRDVGTEIGIDPYGMAIFAIIVAAWLAVAVRARRELGARLLATAAACLVPPAAYVTLNGLSSRNYAGLAVLSAVAIGLAVAILVGYVRARYQTRRPVVVVAVAVVALVAVSFAGVAQANVGPTTEPQIPGMVSGWLRDRVSPGERVVMVFRYHELVALELFGAVDVPELSADRVMPEQSLGDYLWVGLRDQQLFGYRRDRWEASLAIAGTRFLAFAGPHPLTPDELLPALDAGSLPGIDPAATLESGGDWARVYRVDPDAILATPSELEPHLSANAALAWLNLGDAASQADRQRQLIEAGPVIVGRGIQRVLGRLGSRACAVQTDEPGDSFMIVPADAATSRPDARCGP